MALYTRKTRDGRVVYWMRVQVDGREFRRSTKQSNKERAKTFESEFRVSLSKGEVHKGGAIPTIASAVRARLRVAKNGDLTTQPATKPVDPGTLTQYERAAENLVKHLGTVRADQITARAIGKYLEARRTSGRAGAKNVQLGNELQLLRSALRLCQKEHGVPSDGEIKALGNPAKRNPRKYLPSPEELKKYREAAPAVLWDLAVLAASTGLRVGEALALTGANVRPFKDGYVIRLDRAKHRSDREDIEPVYAFHGPACEVIERRAKLETFFPEIEGETTDRRVQKASKRHRALCDRLGLPKRFVQHSFRHAYLSHVANQLGVAVAQRLARHKDANTTLGYVHATIAPATAAASLDLTKLLGS